MTTWNQKMPAHLKNMMCYHLFSKYNQFFLRLSMSFVVCLRIRETLSKTSLIFNSAHFRYIPLCLFQVLLLLALCTSRAAASPIPETTFTAFSRFNNAANFHSQNNGFETKVFYWFILLENVKKYLCTGDLQLHIRLFWPISIGCFWKVLSC